MKLDDLMRHANVWDLEPKTKYKPPFYLAKYGMGVAGDQCICAMEALSIALGAVSATDSPSQVHPFLSLLTRRVNDLIPDEAVRTETLWPWLPTLIGTGRKNLAWEQDIAAMVLDRSLSRIEMAYVIETKDRDALAQLYAAELDRRSLPLNRVIDLWKFATRSYWASKGQSPQEDWTTEQIDRLIDWATAVRVIKDIKNEGPVAADVS